MFSLKSLFFCWSLFTRFVVGLSQEMFWRHFAIGLLQFSPFRTMEQGMALALSNTGKVFFTWYLLLGCPAPFGSYSDHPCLHPAHHCHQVPHFHPMHWQACLPGLSLSLVISASLHLDICRRVATQLIIVNKFLTFSPGICRHVCQAYLCYPPLGHLLTVTWLSPTPLLHHRLILVTGLCFSIS